MQLHKSGIWHISRVDQTTMTMLFVILNYLNSDIVVHGIVLIMLSYPIPTTRGNVEEFWPTSSVSYSTTTSILSTRPSSSASSTAPRILPMLVSSRSCTRSQMTTSRMRRWILLTLLLNCNYWQVYLGKFAFSFEIVAETLLYASMAFLWLYFDIIRHVSNTDSLICFSRDFNSMRSS